MSTVPSGWRRLRIELKRRKVYRTGAAYAVGAFGVWQVVDLIGPALGWPESVLTYLVVGAVGLAPLVLVLAWTFDIRREVGPPSSAPVGSLRRRFLPRSLFLGIAAILSGGFLVWGMWPGPLSAVADFEAGDRILLSRCENATGDPSLTEVLNTALRASIWQSSHVEVLSRSQVGSYMASYMGLDPSTPLTPEIAKEYAIRNGLKALVHCSISQVGNEYVMAASINDPRRDTDLVVLSEEADGTENLLNAIDGLAKEIRSALGESLRSLADAKPLATVATPSLDALRSYTAAIEAEARGDEEEMRRLLEQALAQDSLFARAHGGLAKYYYFRSNIPVAEQHYEAALQNPRRLSDRDRMWIEAGRASDRGQRESAITLYTAYLARWPSDANGWYNLGNQYFRLTRCDPAREAFERALSLDPTLASAYVNMATCLADLGQVDSALSHYDSAFALRPDWKHQTNLNHEYGQLLIGAGRVAAAEEIFSGQFGLSQAQEAQGRRSLALLRTLQGRYREARPLLEEASRLHQALGQNLSEYRDRIFLWWTLEALEDDVGAGRERERVREIMDKTYVSPAWRYHAFRIHLAAGETDRARSILERAEADTLATGPENRASILAMRAWTSLLEGKPEEALSGAQLAEVTADWEMLLVALCQIALATDDHGTAEQACQELAGSRIGTGWEGQEPSILAMFWMGELAESREDAEQARIWYTKFLRFWGEGDEDLRFRRPDGTWSRPIQEARQRVERLNRLQR